MRWRRCGTPYPHLFEISTVLLWVVAGFECRAAEVELTLDLLERRQSVER